MRYRLRLALAREGEVVGMRAVIVFDADNTLWDTDGVFRSAQIAMLQTLGKAGLPVSPESHFGTLRAVDQEIMSSVTQAEYDFRLLAFALILHFSQHQSITEAAQTALSIQPDQLPTKTSEL